MNTINQTIINNTFIKINSKVENLKSKGYIFTHLNLHQDWKKSSFEFICKDHGPFILNGLHVRMGSICPLCETSKNQKLIEEFNRLDLNGRFKLMTETFQDLNWEDFDKNDFINIDHTIRPECNIHGEMITTSRRLIDNLGQESSSCKWCDNVKFKDEEYIFKLNREQFQKEKLSFYYGGETHKQHIKNIFRVGRDWFIEPLDTTKEIGKIDYSKLKGNPDYNKHLSEVRDPSKWDAIFFKLMVQDKSSKFQFSIVYFMNLNDTWLNWYNENISKGSTHEDCTKIIIDTWANAILGSSFNIDIIWSFWSNQKRTQTNYLWYASQNKEKELILPEAIYTKFKINEQNGGAQNFKNLNIPCYWSEFKWESTSNTVSMIRESLLSYSKRCPICKEDIINPVVDHEHTKRIGGTGRIRNNICSNCNVFIAKAENNCNRFGIKLEKLPEVLKNISEYFTEQQFNILHYTEKQSRPTLSKLTANKILKYWDFIYPGKKKKLKYPKSGIITKDWEDAMKLFEEFEKAPKQSFTKNDYKQLLKNIETYNNDANILNISLPKSKRKQLILIPEYPKTKMITPEIQKLIDITKKV